MVDLVNIERVVNNDHESYVVVEKGMKNIRPGDKFRIVEGYEEVSGDPVYRDSNGYTTFVATSEPFMTSEGILGVDAYGYSEVVDD